MGYGAYSCVSFRLNGFAWNAHLLVATKVPPSSTSYVGTCLIKIFPVQAARKNSKTEAASEDTYFIHLFVKTKVLCGMNDPIIMEICHQNCLP